MSISFFLVLLISSVSAYDNCLHQSKATYFSSPSSASAGSCGYGSLDLAFNKGFVAAAASSVYRDGLGCGGCFQVRCKDSRLCSPKGVNVIVTDHVNTSDNNNNTGFVMNALAFNAMAKAGSAQSLKEFTSVEIEYKRVPCNYKNKNLAIRVEESSKTPSNLTIKFLYQGGQTDIMAVDVAQSGSSNWRYMSRSGAVWTTSRAPVSPLQFRMVVTSGYDGKWVWTQSEVLPLDWKVGTIYDAGVKITEVAKDGCSGCD